MNSHRFTGIPTCLAVLFAACCSFADETVPRNAPPSAGAPRNARPGAAAGLPKNAPPGGNAVPKNAPPTAGNVRRNLPPDAPTTFRQNTADAFKNAPPANAPPRNLPPNNGIPINLPPVGKKVTIVHKSTFASADFALVINDDVKIVPANDQLEFSAGRITITYNNADADPTKAEQTIVDAEGTYNIGVAGGVWVLEKAAEVVGKFTETGPSEIRLFELKTDGSYTMLSFLPGTTEDRMVEGNHESRRRGDKYTFELGKLTLSPGSIAGQRYSQMGPFVIAQDASGDLTLTASTGNKTWKRIAEKTINVVGKFKESIAGGGVQVYELKSDGTYDMWTFSPGLADSELINGNHDSRNLGDKYRLDGNRLTLSPASETGQKADQEGPLTLTQDATGNLQLKPAAGDARNWTKLN